MQVVGRHSPSILGALGLCVLASCSYDPTPGMIGGGASSASSGTVSVAVTDVRSQGIQTFTVDVTSLRLGRADGTVTSLLNRPVTVDFSALTDSALLLQSMSVPAGMYDSASITLDFAHATCVLNGEQTPAAIVDSGGAPVSGTITLDIDLNQASFQVFAGRQRQLTFDLDLGQSVDVDAAHNSVAFEPVVSVQVDGSSTQLLTFGALISVSTASFSFRGTIGAPIASGQNEPLGTVTYVANSHTVFHINGVPSAGETGLALLATVPQGTPIQVAGSPDPNSSNIFASFVIAGRGTDNGVTDVLEGDVIDRIGNPSSGSVVQLQVFGHARNSQSTFFEFATLFTAQVNFENTKVVRTESPTILDTDDLTVGQHVRIYGTLNANVMWANLQTSVVRETEVHALGSALSTHTATGEPTTLTMELQQLSLLPQNVFLWPDSGLTPPIPAALVVNAGVLDAALLPASGTPTEIIGFFASVVDSGPDFNASSIINLETAPSLLFVNNKPNGFTVTATTSPTQIQLSIAGTPVAGEKAIIDHGLAGFIQLPTIPAPKIFPAAGSGTYTLNDKQTGSETIFTTFDSFSNGLSHALSQGATLAMFSAVGVYSSATNSVQATRIGAVVQ